MKKLMLVAAIGAGVVSANAQSLTLIDTDSSFWNGTTYSANYANGGGGGFGGTLGNGSIDMDADSSALNVRFNAGAGLNDIVVVLFDTKSGGVLDSQMDDRADGGRHAVSQGMRDGVISYASGFLPDYALAIGNFGSVLFELNQGSTNGHLNFLQFNGAQSIAINRSNLGLGAGNFGFNWTAYYTSGTGFMSNEVMPGPGLGSNNIGFGPNSNVQLGFNRFEAVPEPATMTALALGAAALLRRRKKS